MKQNSLFKGNADFFFGIVIVVFAVSGFILTVNTISDSNSALMPKLLFAFIGAMGLGISYTGVKNRKKNHDDATKVSGAEIAGGILLPGGFLLGAYALINFLGFYVAEGILIVAIMFLQEKVTNGKISKTPKHLAFLGIFTVCAITVMYIIFNMVFGLPTPVGIFGF